MNLRIIKKNILSINRSKITFMKQYSISVIFFGLLVTVNNTYGQEQSPAATQKHSQVIENTVISGHFEIEKNNKERKVTEHINVNYALSPAPFSNILNLELGTTDPMFFCADIVDSKGNKL